MKVMLVLGTVGPAAAADRDVISASDLRFLEKATTRAGMDADLCVAVLAERYHGCSRVPIGAFRAERERVLAEIRAAAPEAVISLGTNGLRSMLNKQTVPRVEELRRVPITIPELGEVPIYATYSLEEASFKQGLFSYIAMDLLTIGTGKTQSQLGDYHVQSDIHPDLAAHLAAGPGTVTFDLETVGLDPRGPNARIRMAVVSFRKGWAQVVPATPDSRFPDWLVALAADPKVRKVGSNIKFDHNWMSVFGYELNNLGDTATAEHVLDENSPSHSLKVLSLVYHPTLGDYSAPLRERITALGGKKNMDLLRDEEMLEYAGGDGDAGIAVWQGQQLLLQKQGLTSPFEQLMELYPVLAGMECNGARIDTTENARLDAAYRGEISDLRGKIAADLGPINPGSAPQLIKALKELVPSIDLQVWNKEEREWEDSTERDILLREAHRHPVIGAVLDYRKRTKLHSVYVEGLRKHLRERGGMSFLHTDYRTDRVETYRLASRNPNLQNLPRNPSTDMRHLNIKNQFVSRFPGGTLIEWDQSQIELREGAMVSGDEALASAFRHGEDVHSQVASMLYGIPLDEVTKDRRQAAKTLNFRVFYGGGAPGLAAALGITREAAQALIDLYFQRFPRLKAWMDAIRESVRQDLQVESRFGFRRRFYAPRKWHSPMGWHIERCAVNFPEQNGGFMITAAGIVKMWREMKRRKLRSKLILTVHDSLVADCPPEEVDEVKQLGIECFEKPDVARHGVDLWLPLQADTKQGPSWGEAA